MTLCVPGGMLRQKHLSLRRTSLFDEDGAASAKPDVEVVSVVRRQADLRRLDERDVDGDAAALGRSVLVSARVGCVVRRLTRRHGRQLDRVAQSVHDLSVSTPQPRRIHTVRRSACYRFILSLLLNPLTAMMRNLQLEPLDKRRTKARMILVYIIVKGEVAAPVDIIILKPGGRGRC